MGSDSASDGGRELQESPVTSIQAETVGNSCYYATQASTAIIVSTMYTVC
jgi:hypothetical protein